MLATTRTLTKPGAWTIETEIVVAMHHVEQRGTSTVIHVDHDLDIASSPLLDASIRLAEGDTDSGIIVSLERCTYCDATGLTVLVRAKKRNGSNLTIVVPDTARCYRAFEITGLSKSLSLSPSLQRALEMVPIALSTLVQRTIAAVDLPFRAAV